MMPPHSALPLVALLTVVRVAAGAYPLYSKSRYSRSLAWAPLPLSYYYPPRSTRPFYYPESDYYYPQEPSYYPVYQSVVPSYYLDQQRPYYYGYDDVTDQLEQTPEGVEDTSQEQETPYNQATWIPDSDENMLMLKVTEPVEELPEDVEVEDGGERGDGAPYGQETWFQDSRLQDSNADVNARFLQNLILAQVYSDANRRFPVREEEEDGDRWVYGEPVKASKSKAISKEDEDVRELKSLVRGPERAEKSSASGAERMERSDKKRKNRKDENIFAAQTKSNDWSEFRSGQYKRNNELKFSSRKSKVSTTAAPEVTPASVRGQKEVVLPRPANPARVPDFQRFVNLRSEPRRSHEPSVYDTIRQLLHMEDKMDEGSAEPENRLKKRSYIPSEESLVAQLGGLKKMA